MPEYGGVAWCSRHQAHLQESPQDPHAQRVVAVEGGACSLPEVEGVVRCPGARESESESESESASVCERGHSRMKLGVGADVWRLLSTPSTVDRQP